MQAPPPHGDEGLAEGPPPAKAHGARTPRQRGIRQLLLGIAVFLPGLLLFLFARDWLLSTFGTAAVGGEVRVRLPRSVALVIGAPMAVGYVLVLSGFYGMVFGARGRTMSAAWSLFRIVFGVFATLTMIVILFLLFALLSGGR